MYKLRDVSYNLYRNEDDKGMGVAFGIVSQYIELIENPHNTSDLLNMKRLLGVKDSIFNTNRQQDCHECLVMLMDIFHETTKRIGHGDLTPYYQLFQNNNKLFIKKINDANTQWEKYIETFGYSLITHLFTGQFITTLSCSDCNTEKFNFESFNNISLDIPILGDGEGERGNGVPTIKHCFSKYFRQETLDCEIDCETCKKRTRMTKRTSIWRFPTILFLNLKRYINPVTRNNSIIKIDNVIKFEIHSNRQILIYDLKCIVNHFGHNSQSGHYTTTVNTETQGWVDIDDNFVRKANAPYHSKGAYILVYVARLK